MGQGSVGFTYDIGGFGSRVTRSMEKISLSGFEHRRALVFPGMFALWLNIVCTEEQSTAVKEQQKMNRSHIAISDFEQYMGFSYDSYDSVKIAVSSLESGLLVCSSLLALLVLGAQSNLLGLFHSSSILHPMKCISTHLYHCFYALPFAILASCISWKVMAGSPRFRFQGFKRILLSAFNQDSSQESL